MSRADDITATFDAITDGVQIRASRVILAIAGFFGVLIAIGATL